MSDSYVIAAEVVPPLDLCDCTSVSACYPSEIVSAFYAIDDSLTVTPVLDLLDGCRVEILVNLMSV